MLTAEAQLDATRCKMTSNFIIHSSLPREKPTLNKMKWKQGKPIFRFHLAIRQYTFDAWFQADISGQPFGPIFKGQEVQHSSWTALPFKIGPMGCPETSVPATNICTATSLNSNSWFLSNCFTHEDEIECLTETSSLCRVVSRGTLQGSYWTASPMMMDLTVCPEMPVISYQSTMCKNPKNQSGVFLGLLYS